MRVFVVAAAITVLTVLSAAPASAASASVTSPSSGSRIDGPTPITASVQREAFEDVGSVRVRLATDGGSAYPGSSPAHLSCQSGCSGTSTTQTWGGVTFDPRRPSAFGISGDLPNARYRLQPSVGGGSFASGTVFVVSVPPSPVSSFSGTVDGHDVRLSWRQAPEPDVSGYRVERRKDHGNWTHADQLGPNATSYAETVTSDGIYRYRVVTLRPDGTGGQLTATSDTVELEAYGEVRSEPRQQPSPSPDGDGSSPADEGTSAPDGPTDAGGSTDDGPGGGGVAAGGGADGGGSGSDDPSAAPSGGTAHTGSTVTRGRRVARPPSARGGFFLDTSIAGLPQPDVAPRANHEEYFGEDGPFSEEIDYSGVDPVTGERIDIPDRFERMIPGALQEFIIERFDPRTLLASVAGGLVLIALALHLARWMHAT